MAKIDWVFQNENGTNLNRYIATNVATGEKITFDLLRGGNISIVGTPLNADNLNSLINAINENYDEFTTLDTKVTNIGNQVETNTKDISSINKTLGNQDNRISANATNIMNNANNIDTNTNNISKLQKSVENLNDTIIEVQEENSIINLGECGDPSSTTNTTLNTILTQGIYKFTNGSTSYLMFIYAPATNYVVQHIFSVDGSGTFLNKVERVSYNSGSSWAVKSYTGATKNYVDTQISNSVKGYAHNIVVGSSAYTSEASGKYYFTLITNSSTPFANGEQLANYIKEVGDITVQANGIYMHFKNTSDSKPTLYHVCSVKIKGTYSSGGIYPQVINSDYETKMFEGYSFGFKSIGNTYSITDNVVPF